MLPYLVFVGAAANLIGSWFYLERTLRGVTKPNRVTFLIWALAPLIATPIAISEGVGWAVLPVFMAGFIPLIIFFASFVNKNAYWKLTRFDYTCGGLSILALILWIVTGDPVLSIFLAILADGLAALPTIVKAWKFPETEYWSGYAGAIFSAFTAFFAVESFTFTAVAFPIYLIIACAVILIGIFHRRIFQVYYGA